MHDGVRLERNPHASTSPKFDHSHQSCGAPSLMQALLGNQEETNVAHLTIDWQHVAIQVEALCPVAKRVFKALQAGVRPLIAHCITKQTPIKTLCKTEVKTAPSCDSSAAGNHPDFGIALGVLVDSEASFRQKKSL